MVSVVTILSSTSEEAKALSLDLRRIVTALETLAGGIKL